MESTHHGLWVIAVSIILGLLAAIYPLHDSLAWSRPDWLLLILMFWLLAVPEHVGIVLCWVCGFIQDILLGVVIGQNAFSLAVIAYIVQVSYQQLRMFSVRKQAALIGLLELFRILVDQWAQNINGVAHTHWLIFLPTLTTALMWLLVRPLLSWCQRHLMS
ncbi:MAG: rod shape-determining protein MreD [Spongiibacter sp.]|uniref:Rod shape-determining protein MreD n=1 Tax=Spongiibacter thalassae TaxID=2721624 RepID=A0ABX1GKP8_9GAMM|nr:rod shape-determining protein MreD [Spongiibacter thalassae]NKI18927.1 rod shape-determining protein MreD [Spongiibacter thalassae]